MRSSSFKGLMSDTLCQRLSATCKFLVFAICSFIAINGKPPMHAAQPSIADVRQDDHLARLDDKATASDQQIASIQEQIRELERLQAERSGEERVIGLIVSLLSGGGLVLQFRKKKGSD